MKRVHVITAGVFILALFLFQVPGGASAGTFTMKQCAGSNQADFQGIYAGINNSAKVDVESGCKLGGSGKLGIYQDRKGSNLFFGQGGQFVWQTPEEIQVTAIDIVARLKSANGISAELIGYNGRDVIDVSSGTPRDGSLRTSSWRNAGKLQSLVAARIICERVADCANQPASDRAYVEVSNAEFQVQDQTAPVIKASGDLWEWGSGSSFHRGVSGVKVEVQDEGSGITEVWAEINNLKISLDSPNCAGDRGSYSTRFSPCPALRVVNRDFNTSSTPFQQGENKIRFCASDYAAADSQPSTACTATRTVKVDSEGPTPPVGLQADQGSGWQPRNGFTFSWDTPPGQRAPIIGAIYQMIDLDSGEQVNSGYIEGASNSNAGPIEVPEVGAYRLRMLLVDGAYNLGQPADTTVRFDDGPPGDVNPEPASGWVSRDEMPIRQAVEEAEPGGPSGIGGYALSVSRDGPSTPCEQTICLAPELTLSGGSTERIGSVGNLAEGDHWVSAVAVSGARRSSLQPGTTLLQVDRTPPESQISGVPNEWVNQPVTVAVNASDELSGMLPQAEDDGTPRTVIHAGDYAPYAVPGSTATFAVATEGVNRIRYWAEDLAGNTNDGKIGRNGEVHQNPGQAVVRIDMTPPQASFKAERDPDDPELVELVAEDEDSGVGSAAIWVRAAGDDSEWQKLVTEGASENFKARIPSDDLAPGTYELKAIVRDRAGNESVVNISSAGDPMILKLPLKQSVSLLAHLEGGKTSLNTRYSKKRHVEGRLTSQGVALRNQPVKLIESFNAGSRKTERITVIHTDGDGRFRHPMELGPSRTLQVAFEGDRKLARVIGPKFQLRVKGKVGLKIKPRRVYNGGQVRMKGKVGMRGALRPARGKLVEIQYLDPSRNKWRPVAVLRADKRGRFRYRYRFRTISSAQKIRFRARVLPEAGWPYRPSTSRPRSVIVFPKDSNRG